MAHLVTQVSNPDEKENLELDENVYDEEEAPVEAGRTGSKWSRFWKACWAKCCNCFRCCKCCKKKQALDKTRQQTMKQEPSRQSITMSSQQSGGRKPLLPPMLERDRGKKTLVLDLDETLVHSSFKPVPNADFVISIELEGVIHHVYVMKRPGVDAFLKAVGEKFEVVVFTASLALYADPVCDILDPLRTVRYRLFREDCVQYDGNFIKDMSLLGRDLKKVCIIDNSPLSYMFHPENALPIISWFNDPTDRELIDMLPLLYAMADADDVYQVLQRRAMSTSGFTDSYTHH